MQSPNNSSEIVFFNLSYFAFLCIYTVSCRKCKHTLTSTTTLINSEFVHYLSFKIIQFSYEKVLAFVPDFTDFQVTLFLCITIDLKV